MGGGGGVAGPFRLAIDLGTCNTVAVVRRGADAPRALLFDGSPLLPSGVYCDRSGSAASHPGAPGGIADVAGSLVVGRDAERMMVIDPARFEPFPKRRVDDGSILLGETEVPVVDMLAAPLRRIVAEAAQAGVMAAGATVLTCPADWGPRRRAVLLAAASSAGLGAVPLVDEPIAAATYCLEVLRQQVGVGQCLAIFDFGGGTLDVTVVRRDPFGLRVLATGGLDDLGGVDVDAALVGHLGQLIALRAGESWQRIAEPRTTGELRDRRTFWSEVRGAKEMLSRAAAAPIQVPGSEQTVHLTREELERVAGPLIDRAVDETRRVLERGGIHTGQLAAIFLVGGSSRIPLVASRLHARFGVAPAVPEQPELPVAHGALLAADAALYTPAEPARGDLSGSARGGPGAAGMVMAPPPRVPQPITPPGGFAVGAPTTGSPITGTPVSGSPAFPTSIPPYPSSPAPAPGPPQAPPMAPMTGPVRGTRRRRRRSVPLVITAVVLAIVGSIGYGVFRIAGKAARAINQATGQGTVGGLNGGGGKLTAVSDIALPGAGAAAGVSDGTTAFYAVTGSNQTDVYSIPRTGGAGWHTVVKVEAEKLRLTAIAGLLVMDADRAATHQGKDVRSVLDAASGKELHSAIWEDRLDVAFIGTDEIVETRDPPAVMRVDLRSGGVKWNRKGPDDLITIEDRRLSAAATWPAAGASSAPGSAVPGLMVSGIPNVKPSIRDAFGASPSGVVELDEKTGKGYVLDTNTGRPAVTGNVPFKTDMWLAFDGTAIGVLANVSGRDVVAGYGLDKLTKSWQVDEPAGVSVQMLKPCGPQLICVKTETTASDYQVTAYNVVTGKQAWTKQAPFDAEPNWYVLGGRLVYGEDWFGKISDPTIVDPANGNQSRAFSTRTSKVYAIAANGQRVVLMGSAVSLSTSKVSWQVAVADAGSGASTGPVTAGSTQDQPTDVTITGDTVTVVTADRHFKLLRVGT
jgi:actin-like ATPase involved in cell morphogenesis